MNPPDLLCLNGDWGEYVNELYRVFEDDLLNGHLQFLGLNVRCGESSTSPKLQGRHSLFWHIIQEGRIEDEREPNLRRCERLPWIRWIIENARNCDNIEVWQNMRDGKTNTLLWYREEYLVVLSARRNYWLLKTAYHTLHDHRSKKLRIERDSFQMENWRGPPI